MANNRLYIVDTETTEYLMIAKNWDVRWKVGNINLYREFMYSRIELDETNLIFVTENNDNLYKKWIENGTNFNKKGHWNYK